MRKNIVAGNWKMNTTMQEGVALADQIKNLLIKSPNCEVVLCVPFTHLTSIAQTVNGSIIAIGAENCSDKESGAYTGEISAAMVRSTGAKYVIIGHSERRTYYGETAEILKEKVLLALKNDLIPVFCIGEVKEERQADKQNDIVKAQLEKSVFNLSVDDFSKIVFAYEPVWAIGTGLTATPEQAQQMHACIRQLIAEKYGNTIAQNTSILYGGSCNAQNAATLFANHDVDGGLIGSASLKATDFKAIIDAI
ncbi:MAG: triose-phosphate isomerase [Paludibacter sp.]|nr:triose-phosphate isomerase [Paludibacter sp.]